MSFDPLPLQNSIFAPFPQEIKIENFDHFFVEDDKCNTHFQSPEKKTKKHNTKAKERVKKPQDQGRLVGHWNTTQKKRYHWFLEMFHGHFENKYMRRMDKIFKSMADFIGSRAADQCRSHHQKMQKKFKSFYNIICNLRMGNYNTIETGPIEEQLGNNSIQIPDRLMDMSLLGCHPSETKENVESRESEEEKGVKVESGEVVSEQERNYEKRFDFMEEVPYQPLI